MDNHKFISASEHQIFYDVVTHLHADYCRESGRKLFVVTYSLSGNWAGLALAFKNQELKSKVQAAVLVQPPLDVRRAMMNLRTCWFGFIDWHMLQKSKKWVWSKSMTYLVPKYKEKMELDL